MNRITLLLVFVLTTLVLDAQEKYFFTSFWRLTNEKDASFYRVSMIDPENQKFVGEFIDYTIENQKLQEGSYSSEGLKNGYFKFYFPNGNLHSEGEYSSNRFVGIWKFYFETAQIKQTINFDKNPFIVLNQVDTLGNDLIKNGAGKWICKFSFGIVEGEQFEFKRIGNWTVKFANGEQLAFEEYQNGSLIGGEESNINHTFFTEYVPNYLIEELKNHNAIISDYPQIKSLPDSLIENDSTDIFTKVEEMPQHRFSDYEYFNFLYSNLNFLNNPVFSEPKKFYVELKIDRMGNAYEVRTVKGIANIYDREVERVMAQTKWIPGYQKGTPVNVILVKTLTIQKQ